MRVLLAEDDRSLAVLLCDRFVLAGHEVSHAADGESAWLLLQETSARFDVLVCDWMLPRLNGLELCRRVKAGEAPKRLPVLILTAKSEASDERAAYEAGADAFMTKPFDFKVLLAWTLRLAQSP